MTAPFPIMIGPTAGGKSALAVALASQARGEVITADSIQIYMGLDIGSAKPTREEQKGIPHHLIDLVEPKESFSVHQWLKRAERSVAEVRARGNLPIVVGGTHLYVKALLDGLFEGPEVDPALREALNARELSDLRAELDRADPVAAGRINPSDRRRTVRALEVFRQTGSPISTLQAQWDSESHRRKDAILVGLEWPVELINRRINARVKDMIDRGLVEEARSLWESNRFGTQSREALGYKQLIAHFEGRCTLDEAIERIKIETRRFAKNQRTWAKRLKTTPGSVWLDGTKPIEELVSALCAAMEPT